MPPSVDSWAVAIPRFSAEKSFCARQFTIIGEAVTQLARLDPTTAALLPDRHAIIGLRNILVHAYGRVDHEVIADIVAHDVPELARIVVRLLESWKE